MNTKKYFALFVLLLAACTTTSMPRSDGSDVALGQEAMVDGPVVKPIAVIEDSRCPMNARCVWAGQVRLSVRIATGKGTVVREKAVLGAGVILTRGTPVFDLVRETVHRGSAERPLEIPAGAVVVPGARAVKGGFGAAEGLSLQTPVIVKYRDERTDLATALESWLR